MLIGRILMGVSRSVVIHGWIRSLVVVQTSIALRRFLALTTAILSWVWVLLLVIHVLRVSTLVLLAITHVEWWHAST